MGEIAMVAEGSAGRASRMKVVERVPGVADTWVIDLVYPRMVRIGDGIATMTSVLALLCVRIDALPEVPNPIIRREVVVKSGTHAIGVGLAEDQGSGSFEVSADCLLYAEFDAKDDATAARVAQVVASCIAWGSVPIGARGSRVAYGAAVAAAAAAIRHGKVREPE